MNLSDGLAHLALEALHPRLHPLKLLLEVEHRLDASEVEPELGGQLLDQAQPLEDTALATFKACVADAAAAGITGVWPEQCQHELEVLDPTVAP